MSTEVEKEEKIEEPKNEPIKSGKGLLQIAEVRMLLYVIPVVIVLALVAIIINSFK